MPTFFKSKKKKEELKVLTENEIQNKLYGKYQGPRGKPAGEAPAESSPESPDLFFPAQSSLESSRQAAKVESWIRQEQHSLRQEVSKLKPRESLQPSTASWARGMVSLPIAMVKGLVRGFSKVNFSDAPMRNTLYWLGAVSFLAAVFMAIHLLNSHREKAMKARPKVSSATLEETDLSLPLELLSSEEAPETPEQALLGPESEEAAAVSAEKMKPYVVQIATYVGPRDAERMAALLQGEGFPAFVQELRRQNGKVYHCVFIGRFKDHREAEKALEAFRKKEAAQPFQDAFVRTLAQA